MSDAIGIRRADVTDAPALAHHRMQMFRDMGSVHASIEPALGVEAERHIRDAMLSGEYVAWVAHPANAPTDIVGGAGLQLRRLLPRPDAAGTGMLIGREGIVLNVYVERPYRRRGVARRLMEAVVAAAPALGVVRLVLHASAEGRPLYESMGFEPTNEMRFIGRLEG